MKRYIIKLLLFLFLLIRILLCLILFIISFICSYALYDSYQIYDDSKIDYELEELIKEENGLDNIIKTNKNIVGWITIDDTSINYPILKGKDNIEYLNKNYKDEYSFSGSIFLDYRNNNFKDNYSIIYGHNLYRGGMFSDIKRYEKKKYFNKHLSGKLYTTNKTYNINVISYGVFKSIDEFIYDINKYNINEIFNKSLIKKSLNKNSKYILLSTCKSSSSNDRLILLCELKSSS